MCEAMMQNQNYPRLSRQPRPTVPHAIFAASGAFASYLRNILKNSYLHRVVRCKHKTMLREALERMLGREAQNNGKDSQA